MHELLSPAINFSILVIGLFVLLRKPVAKALADRREQIASQMRDSAAAKREAEAKLKEFETRLASFETEAREILNRAERDAKASQERIIQDAHATAERIVKEAELTAQANVAELKDQIRRETISRIMTMAEKMIRDKVSSDDQRRIVNEYVGKVN